MMNWGGRECNSRLLRKKQWLRQTRTACFHQMSCRDGAVQRYFVVKRCGAAAPQLCSIIPPGSNLAGANRGTVGGSRRGWGKSLPAVVTLTKNRLCGCFVQQTTKLEVVQDGVTSAQEREVMGSIPTWLIRASSMNRAANVPWSGVPVRQFSRLRQGEKKCGGARILWRQLVSI